MAKEFKKEDLEIVVSTMNRKNLDFLIPMFPFSHFSEFSILIINQTTENDLLSSDFSCVRVINSFEKGLSKSRNLGLRNTTGKIILIADDDIIYKVNFDEKIIQAHNEFSKATILSFCIEKPNGSLFKKYFLKPKKKLSLLELFGVLSVEITINTKNIDRSELIFDEKFGLGSSFQMGEEAIFLADIKEKKKSIGFFPSVIAIHPEISSNEKINIAEKYYIQGAFLARVLKGNYNIHLAMKLFFDLKQRKLQINQIPMALKKAKLGRIDFYQLENQNNA
ncbi:glycosyltransferase [Flavobacterium hydrophilum]|uniref:Glycosyltransferase 2-like domain-containing protein n=1 Tax=Flavobacterium hydrophilum TaxID=2211445 RepID=A0A2V4BWS5_9FLAO|nr:glycosyltransferase [Flavobacterium hydrophilum]PXY43455.1 hypothetical protein DMB68_20660 [Flavobacterium hydrophilum]